MKKKLTILLGNAQVTGNARFKTLYHAYQHAADALDKAKSERAAAKKAYHQALQENKQSSEQVFELLAGFRKAKFWRQYQRVDFQLAEYRLRQWIEEFEEKSAKKAATKTKKVATKGKKAAPAGKASRTSAKPLNKKAGDKAKPIEVAATKPAKKTAKNKPAA